MTKPDVFPTLLVIHQEKWQKQLLEQYGNTMSMLDATYKTMKQELALFFLCVRINVGYSVVAEFIVQEESVEKIAEALGVIKQWNPSWNPSFFTTDYSEAELLAIEQVFPSAKSFICDFHWEQAWERWVRDHKHGLTKEQGEETAHVRYVTRHIWKILQVGPGSLWVGPEDEAILCCGLDNTCTH